MNDPCHASPPVGRRNFFKSFLATIIGVVLGIIPVAAGLEVLLDPLRRKVGASSAIRIATLEALPDDGVPRKFPVLANRVDAWNKFTQIPIGAVYLRRTGDQVQALNAVCPHAGCNVDFLRERNVYLCPCHNSTFTVAGRIGDPSSPAARGLDSLDVEIRGNEVWVKFQNFRAGQAEKIPVA
jgi:menaquinol-cytochrome c reductase iron-sulfur subunit